MARGENFPVAFLLAPRDVRADMAVLHRFCLTTDDLGDEGGGGPAERLGALDAWEADLRGAGAGTTSQSPSPGRGTRSRFPATSWPPARAPSSSTCSPQRATPG